MKRYFKSNIKGFSMIELLVALLIMAVIAGIAISLYGGILNNAKGNADTETAKEIKKQIIIYMNASNDMNLSCITHGGSISGNNVVDALATTVIISSTTIDKDFTDIVGSYGPYFENSSLRPQLASKKGWDITISSNAITVDVSASNDNGNLVINP